MKDQQGLKSYVMKFKKVMMLFSTSTKETIRPEQAPQ